MGTINIVGEGEFIYDKDYYKVGRKSINSLTTCKTFLNKLRFKKAQKHFECCICKKEKPKYTRYIGGSGIWERVCCDCSSEWIKNSFNELEKIKQIILKNKTDFELNKNKWKKEMILGELS